MFIETLLPLGKVDPGLRTPDRPLDLHTVAHDARLVESLGYHGLVTEETRDDPFVILSLAAAATTTLQLTTSVAIAFARSPTSMAMSAWSLQKLSRGRFTLGLGSQVRAHITRRYGMPAHPPAPWMREYAGALRALWRSWQEGTTPDIRGNFYNIDLRVPLFDPGPIEHPHIPVHLAAVNPLMCRVAGEVADGLRPHPVCTPAYIHEVMFPEVRRGAAATGRPLDTFEVCMKPLVATARNETELVARIDDARARIAFYASTPAYARAFAFEGLEALAVAARRLSREQRWNELPGLIDDAVLDRFVVIGTHAEIGDRLLARYGDTVTRIEFSIAVQDGTDRDTLSALTRRIARHPAGGAHAALIGRG
jgi:probable F420-dependent oxidoreductase